MSCRRWLLAGLLGLCAAAAPARGDDGASFTLTPGTGPAIRLPLDRLPPEARQKLGHVLDKPSVTASGPAETFVSPPALYRWLLDHPDLTAKLWHLLGANVSEVKEHNGRYRWADDKGSEVFWSIALRAPGLHVWYAEGKVKPALLVPLTSFKAVVYLKYTEGKDTEDQPAIQHRVHFVLRCDSRAIALAMRLLGKSAPGLAEQYLGHLQTFYGGMAWYLHADEERARKMYRQLGLPVQVGGRE